jgi:transposase InsO family protein
MFRRKLYDTLEAIQTDVDQWLKFYNYERPHSGHYEPTDK